MLMLLGRKRTLCRVLLCSLVLLATVSSASWIPNESAAAAAEYQNRGPSGTAYELTLGDLLPEHLLRQGQSLNFVNKHFRWVFCPFESSVGVYTWTLDFPSDAYDVTGLLVLRFGLSPHSSCKLCIKLQKRSVVPPDTYVISSSALMHGTQVNAKQLLAQPS